MRNVLLCGSRLPGLFNDNDDSKVFLTEYQAEALNLCSVGGWLMLQTGCFSITKEELKMTNITNITVGRNQRTKFERSLCS